MALMLGSSPARAAEVCPCFKKAEILGTCEAYFQKTERKNRYRDYLGGPTMYKRDNNKPLMVGSIGCGIRGPANSSRYNPPSKYELTKYNLGCKYNTIQCHAGLFY